MWANARAHEEQEYIFGIHFWPYNRKKLKPTNFANFFGFLWIFRISSWNCETYVFPKERYWWLIFLPKIQLFKLYKIGYLSIDSETLVFFLGETPWNRPTVIITFFAITQEGVDQSFSSSKSTEISIRRFYAQNFITIGLAFQELLC
jgi:hypothetical protein